MSQRNISSWRERQSLRLTQPPRLLYRPRGMVPASQENMQVHDGLGGDAPHGPYDVPAHLRLEQPGIPQQQAAMDEETMQSQRGCASPSSEVTTSQNSSSLASGSSDSSENCPNCSDDHPLKHCPYPNTMDGRLQACFDCENTDHPWFLCDDYQKNNQKREFHLIYVARQGLCPVVHDKQLHLLWREYFPQLNEDIQALNLRRPGPLTPQFVLRMLRNEVMDPEVERQITHEDRLLPCDLAQDVLDCYQLRVKSTVLDPATRLMSHEVVYTNNKKGKKQKPKVVGPHSFRFARRSLQFEEPQGTTP